MDSLLFTSDGEYTSRLLSNGVDLLDSKTADYNVI
jgi:hypothetical protein